MLIFEFIFLPSHIDNSNSKIFCVILKQMINQSNKILGDTAPPGILFGHAIGSRAIILAIHLDF